MEKLEVVLEVLGYIRATEEEIKAVQDLEIAEDVEYIGEEDKLVYISKESLIIPDDEEVLKSDIFYMLDMHTGDAIGYFKRA